MNSVLICEFVTESLALDVSNNKDRLSANMTKTLLKGDTLHKSNKEKHYTFNFTETTNFAKK